MFYFCSMNWLRLLRPRLRRLFCRHRWVPAGDGGMHYSGGEVYDTYHFYDVCQKCGTIYDPNPR